MAADDALWWRYALWLVILKLGVAASLAAQVSMDNLSSSPGQVAQDAVNNEIKLIQYDRSYLRYKVHTRDSKGEQVRDVIETREGTVARVVSRGGRALTADEDAGEHGRLQAMLDSPAAFKKHIDKDQTGKKLAVDLIRLLPDAMNFSYVAGQPQRDQKPPSAAPDLVMDFEPNPRWSPPTMTSQALTGIRGRVWVEAKGHHLTRLEVTIFQGINFGFGMLVHIYPGGKLFLEQQPVGGDRWIVDHFIQQVTMRAMMVRTLKENTDLEAYSFTPVREMSYQEAIQTLLSTPLPAAAH